MTAITGRDRYAGGYGPLTIQGLQHRTLARDGAFFVPYLAPDMRVLDCGCGPGVLTIELAGVVADGVAIGVDLEPGQVALARERAGASGCRNARFECGDVYALPFETASFDAVLAHAVLYHLRDPERALREIARVLKPGGFAGLRDADSGGDLYAPSNPLVDRAWSLVTRVFEHNGASLRFGRTQRAALRAAGFVRTQASASYDYVGTGGGTRWFSTFWAQFLGQQHAAVILDEGWATQPELDELLAALAAWGEHPDAFYGRCRCEALGWKDARLNGVESG
jgi:ubiquinone/menaquinone biosynthesis C-methylase UbiE